MSQTVYIKKYIKTEDDLPKEVGEYKCMFSGNSFGKAMYNNDFASSSDVWWINKVDWYLQPIEQPEIIAPTDEEIKNHIPYSDTISDAQLWKNVGFIKGAKWAINEIIKRNK
jgi:hypothetical protein